MHGSVIVSHFREFWLSGLFFAIVTPLQIAWAAAVWRRPQSRWLLAAGAAGNLAVVGVWATTRVVGLPFGPDRFVPEAVGFLDVLATLDEIVLAALALGLSAQRATRPLPSWAPAAAWPLVAVSVLVALAGGIGH